MSNKSNISKGSFDGETFEKRYAASLPIQQALLDEARFILESSIAKADIKIHEVTGRLKEKDVIIKKCTSQEIGDPFLTLGDIVGCRVVCLFRSDIEKIGQIIETDFDVVEKDDKINSSTDYFGYMSVHYICKMKSEYSGPRYDAIKNRKFEIQVRTLSMHAWAAISHYLDYKGEWDVPAHLKKALNALSGLFYVADNEFESFYHERQKSKNHAVKSANSPEEKQNIDLDTLSAYLQNKFPERAAKQNLPAAILNSVISELTKEILEAGYKTLQDIDDALKHSEKAFNQYEEDHMKLDPNIKSLFFAPAGVVRISLSIASPEFRDVFKKHHPNSDVDKFAPYKKFLKS